MTDHALVILVVLLRVVLLLVLHHGLLSPGTLVLLEGIVQVYVLHRHMFRQRREYLCRDLLLRIVEYLFDVFTEVLHFLFLVQYALAFDASVQGHGVQVSTTFLEKVIEALTAFDGQSQWPETSIKGRFFIQRRLALR